MPPDAETARERNGPRRLAVGQVDRLLLFRSFPGFSDLDPTLIAVLAEYSRERFFPKGSQLYREGTPIDSIHFIVSGRVEVRRHGQHLRELGEKSTIGGLAAFANDPYGYDVIAMEDTVSLEQKVDDAVDIFEDHFPILRNVLRAISKEVLSMRRTMGTGAGFVDTTEEAQPSPHKPLDLVERMALIRKTMTFAGSRLDAVADMAREATERRFPTGTTIWREGDPPDEMIIIVAGVIDCTTSDGQHFRFGPGDVIGALDGSAGEPRWFTTTVSRDVVGLSLPTETLYDVFEDNFDVAMDLLEGLSGALMAIHDRKAGLTLPSMTPATPD